jgi:nucleotide-binding universal stress UspA family protein
MSYHSSPDHWPADQMAKRRRLVHASDGSEASFRALETAFEVAQLWGATLLIVFVADSFPQSDLEFEVDVEQRRRDRRLARLKRRVDSIACFAVPHRTYSFTGQPVRRVLQFVKEARADLLVIGATRARGLFDLALGSRSDRIARRAACSVLIVRDASGGAVHPRRFLALLASNPLSRRQRAAKPGIGGD